MHESCTVNATLQAVSHFSGTRERMTMDIHHLAYHHVDVFSARAFTGNSLTIFPESHTLSKEQMLRITQEMRHFESIFLFPMRYASSVRARVFDLHEELDFAGHPLLVQPVYCTHFMVHQGRRRGALN